MNDSNGLKEFPYLDKIFWVKDRAKEILKSVADYIDNYKESVELILKIAFVVIGVLIAIKDMATDARVSKKGINKGHAHIRLYCFGLDLLNILKRVLL